MTSLASCLHSPSPPSADNILNLCHLHFNLESIYVLDGVDQPVQRLPRAKE
jgi:hypothetical protein